MDNKFTYSYSTKQQEVEAIRKKYLPKKESALEQMKKLDNHVTKKVTIIAIAFGIINTLILGIGMCFTMVLGNQFFIKELL